MKHKNIPKGYKDSPLGIIPKEWEVKRLGEICDKITDGTHGTPQKQNSGKPFLTAIHIKDGWIDYDNCYYLTEKDHEEIYKRCNPQFGDILMVNIGAGVCSVAMNRVNYEFSLKNVALLKPNLHFCTGKYLEYILQYRKKIIISSLLNGGAQPFLGLEDISKIKIIVPPITEQKKIAKILSVWDEAIEKQTKLINALTRRKHALSQQLLTGEKRLPGFNRKWEKVTIKKIAKEIKTRNKNNRNLEVLSCTKYDGLVPSLKYFGRQIFSKDLNQYKIAPKYCFAYATNHIEEGSIGYQDLYNESLISPMYTVFETNKNKVDDFFLYKLLKSHQFIYIYSTMMEGSINRRGGLNWSNFSTIKFNLQPMQEQKAITKIISTAESTINSAKQLLESFHLQKQGLMQQLLTGKINIQI